MSFPGLTNYGPIRIPGTDVDAYLGHWTESGKWVYSLWDSLKEGWDDGGLIVTGSFNLPDLPEYVTPGQVARIAFLLEVEYA